MADILALLDAILFFATGGKVQLINTIIRILSPFSSKYLTELQDTQFLPPEYNFETVGGITAVGDKFIIIGPFTGYIGLKPQCGGIGDFFDGRCIDAAVKSALGEGWGPEKALSTSRVYGRYLDGGVDTNQIKLLDTNENPVCEVEGYGIRCRNNGGLVFRFEQARNNIALKFQTQYEYIATYTNCISVGVTGACYLKTNDERFPKNDGDGKDDEDDELKDFDPSTVFIDVIPNTLDGLWNWDVTTNPDRDGDELTDAEENRLGTDVSKWDSDNDGLSDGYENAQRTTLGTDPLKADSDNDGLTDGEELLIFKTDISKADSDNDGLKDGEEVYRLDSNNQPTGGWEVTLPGRLPFRVYSDPNSADADGDGIQDGAEKRSKTSPYAVNAGPGLFLSGDPIVNSPDGTAGYYLEPGDSLKLTSNLVNGTPNAITRPWYTCIPTFVNDTNAPVLTGDRTPPVDFTRTQCNGETYSQVKVDFSVNAAAALQQGELLNLAYQGQIPGAYPASISGTLYTSVAYLGPDDDDDGQPDLRVQQRTLPLIVDKDDPTSTLVAPQDGLYLRGNAYVVGGTSSDPSTWVTKVEVDLGDGNWQEINDITALNPWAIRWDLPADNVYTLRTRATDYVGRVGAIDSVQVTVDNTPPQVTLATTTDIDGVIYLQSDPTNPKAIPIDGTATDNLAGIERVQISLDNRPWREVTYDNSNDSWQYEWTLPARDAAQGEHSLRLRAFDKSGNASGVVSQEVVVDVLPPTSRLTDSAFGLTAVPNVPAGQPLDLTGFLDENGRGPQPARPNPLRNELNTLQDATIWLEPFSIGDIAGGAQVVWLGDMNGDRLADAAIGLPTAGDNDEGAVSIVYGQPGDWPVPPFMQALDQAPTAVVGDTSDRLGAYLAAPGDVNGDGLDDLVIGRQSDAEVWILFGNFNPLGRVTFDQLPKSTRMTIKLDQALRFVSAAGDVDGDGLGDYFIGESNRTNLVLGRSVCCDQASINDMAVAQLSQSGQHTMLGVGDLDGDQYDDFIATANNKVHVFEGDVRYTRPATATQRIRNPIQLQVSNALASFDSTDTIPRVAALSDTSGNNLADFIYSNDTTPQMVMGQTDAPPVLGQALAFTPAVSGFLAGPGDVNGDGCTDIILGNTAENAVLVHGVGQNCASAYEVIATFTQAVGAASAPGFTAGADLNADNTADILLIPQETGPAQTRAIRFGNQPYINPNQLPLGPASNRNNRHSHHTAADAPLAPTAVTRYVDDDYCDTCPNDGRTWGVDAFNNATLAINASTAGDTVQFMPGVYSALDLTNAQDYLTIRGIDPDAVFLDGLTGTHVVRINGAKGIRLENLTLRNADHGLELITAGENGYDNPADKIYLRRLLIHSTTNPIFMDRISNLVIEQTTLVGDGTNANIWIDPANGDPSLQRNWNDPADPPDPAANNGAGGQLITDGSQVFALAGGNSNTLSNFNTNSSNWSNLTPAPVSFGSGSIAAHFAGAIYTARGGALAKNVNGVIHAIAADVNGNIYVGGEFSQVTNPDGTVVAANNIAVWNGQTWDKLGDNGVQNANFNADPNRPRPAAVYEIAITGTDVYVGGRFNNAGPLSNVNNIALWDGTNWNALDNGVGVPNCGSPKDPAKCDTFVSAVAINGLDIYVGGSFTQVGTSDLYAQSVARWDGTTWHKVGGLQQWGGAVHDLLYQGGYLYATGTFDFGLGLHFARYDTGTGWDAVAQHLTNPGLSLAGDGTSVYVGTIDGQVARLEGTTFTNLDAGGMLNGAVKSLVFSDGHLYAAGSFTQAGGQSARHLARWNGSAWEPLGAGAGARPTAPRRNASRSMRYGSTVTIT